jgi:hypothetical protein
MQPVSRRSFIATGSAGALGVAGAAVLGNPLAAGASPAADDSVEASAHDINRLSGPALLAVRDARKGKVELLIGDRSIEFTDKRLVARLARAGR